MNIKLKFASTAALVLIAGSPALAAKSQNDRSAAGAPGAKAKGERKTCRTFDSTESRLGRTRLCLTREQWKKFEEERWEAGL